MQLALLVTQSLLTLTAATLPLVQVDVNTRAFVDEYGQTRLFHGVNVVEKVGDLLPSTDSFNIDRSLAKEDLELLSSWGMNVVRLGVLWSGVMPTCDSQGVGIVNSTYLDKVKTLIESMAAKGIYTLVDAHQDNLNLRTCGEGVPTWAYDKALLLQGFNRSDPRHEFPHPLPFKIPLDADGFPSLDDCQKYQFFLEGESTQNIAAWNGIYKQPEIQQDFADSWGAVAKALAGTPGLLGYELLNEPWNTEPWIDDTKTLFPLYKAAASAIRSHDNDTLLFFESLVFDSYLSVVFIQPNFPVYGVEGEAYADRQVYAYHSYCVPFGDDRKTVPLDCKVILSNSWRSFGNEFNKLKLGGFLTEFGAVGNDPASLQLLRLQADYADTHQQSWAYWTYKGYDDITTQNAKTESFFNDDGTQQKGKIKELARSYPYTTAGDIQSISFSPESAKFELKYTTTAKCVEQGSKCQTSIFISEEYYYSNGVDVYATPAGKVSWSVSADGRFVIVSHPGLLAGVDVSLVISPK